jgi:hypothetical protein
MRTLIYTLFILSMSLAAHTPAHAASTTYHAQPFYVDQDGAYTLRTDAGLYLYQVNDACADCPTDFQPEITASLTANTQYMIVTTVRDSETFNVDITGPGHIYLNEVIENDTESPVELYTVNYSSLVGLHIYQMNPDGSRSLALEITPDMLQNLAADKVEFVGESSDGYVQVYHLPNGKWQVNTTQRNGKIYVAIFDTDPNGIPLYGYVM